MYQASPRPSASAAAQSTAGAMLCTESGSDKSIGGEGETKPSCPCSLPAPKDGAAGNLTHWSSAHSGVARLGDGSDDDDELCLRRKRHRSAHRAAAAASWRYVCQENAQRPAPPRRRGGAGPLPLPSSPPARGSTEEERATRAERWRAGGGPFLSGGVVRLGTREGRGCCAGQGQVRTRGTRPCRVAPHHAD